MLYLIALVFSITTSIMACLLFFLGLNKMNASQNEYNKKSSKEDFTNYKLNYKLNDSRRESSKNKENAWQRNILIFAVLLLGASFGGLEWAFYLLGYNMFIYFAFPLIAYFAVWFAFIIWIFEHRNERWLWIVFLILLIIIIVTANMCMNCVQIS